MQTLKTTYDWLTNIFGAYWIVSLFDTLSITNLLQFSLQEMFNSFLHSLFMAFGVLFFALGGWYKHKIKNEEIKAKRIANKRAEMELDNYEHRRKKN